MVMRHRLEPGYDADAYAVGLPPAEAMPASSVQPPAGPPSSTAPQGTPPPRPYEPPAANDAISRKINEAFYPSQTMAASAVAAKKAKKHAEDDVPDMFEIANQHPSSYGNAQNVLLDTPEPPAEPKP